MKAVIRIFDKNIINEGREISYKKNCNDELINTIIKTIDNDGIVLENRDYICIESFYPEEETDLVVLDYKTKTNITSCLKEITVNLWTTPKIDGLYNIVSCFSGYEKLSRVILGIKYISD